MFLVIRTAMISIFFMVLCSVNSISWGQTENLSIFLHGEEIKLSVKNETGRFYGLEQEINKLVPNVSLSAVGLSLDSKGTKWLPLRTFWESIGYKVSWLPEIRAMIISKNEITLNLPQEALNLIAKAISDTEWLTMKTKEELQVHLEGFYSPQVVQDLIGDTWNFIQVETDWHSLYQLMKVEVLDGSEDYYLLKVIIEEQIASQPSPALIKGVIGLQKLEIGWRITSYRYYGE